MEQSQSDEGSIEYVDEVDYEEVTDEEDDGQGEQNSLLDQ